MAGIITVYTLPPTLLWENAHAFKDFGSATMQKKQTGYTPCHFRHGSLSNDALTTETDMAQGEWVLRWKSPLL